MSLDSIAPEAGWRLAATRRLGTTTAVVLAGGQGTRLRSVVGERQKVLATVNGRPFLEHLLTLLTRQGIRRVVLCTGFHGDDVEARLGETHGGASLIYSRELTPLGTGGALAHAMRLVESDPALVLNGDSYCSADLSAFYRWHCAQAAEGTVLLTPTTKPEQYGWVEVADDGRVQRFVEKPPSLELEPLAAGNGASPVAHDDCRSGGTQCWVSAGIYLLSQRLLRTIPTEQVVSLESEMFPRWAGRVLYGFRTGATFLDIGTPESLARGGAFLGRLADGPDRSIVAANGGLEDL
jgi:NDP-sugar pyrophosphorylase family protein